MFSPRVLTVTLNPAFDKTILLNSLVTGNLNRVQQRLFDAGGKGLNVSKALNILRIPNIAIGILPSIRSLQYLELIERSSINHNFILIPNESIRENIKIIEETGTLTEINEEGKKVPTSLFEEFSYLFTKSIHGIEAVALSGSLAPGIPVETYNRLLMEVFPDTITALDTRGEALSFTLSRSPLPSILHLNLEELMELGVLPNSKGIFRWSKKIDIPWIIISHGAKGGWAINQSEMYRFYPPKITPISTVGAGDVLTGALIRAKIDNMAFIQAISAAVAYATASVETRGISIELAEKALKFENEVRIEKITP